MGPSKGRINPPATKSISASVIQHEPSSISPIVYSKGKHKADLPDNPRPSTTGVDLTYTDHSISQLHDSVPSISSSAPIAHTVYRSRKHRLQNVNETESDERTSRSHKRVRIRRDGGRKALPMEVISISSDDELSIVDNNEPLQQLPQAFTTTKRAPTNIMRISSGEDKSSLHENQSSLDASQSSLDNDYRRPSSEDSMSNFIVADGGQPSSPPPSVRDIRRNIRGAIIHITKDDNAREKGTNQMNMLIAVMTEHTDLVITMKTGGGKSMLWMVPSVMDQGARSIVVCPSVSLLCEQYTTAADTGLRCHNYCMSKMVPNNVQILFVRAEDCQSEAFSRYENSDITLKGLKPLM